MPGLPGEYHKIEVDFNLQFFSSPFSSSSSFSYFVEMDFYFNIVRQISVRC